MGVDKVEAATTERTPELEASLGVACLRSRPSKARTSTSTPSACTSSTKSRTKQPAEGSAFGRVHVGETEYIHATIFGVWRVTGCAAAHARPRGLRAPAVALVAGLEGPESG
jgi:hypothetical protein